MRFQSFGFEFFEANGNDTELYVRLLDGLSGDLIADFGVVDTSTGTHVFDLSSLLSGQTLLRLDFTITEREYNPNNGYNVSMFTVVLTIVFDALDIGASTFGVYRDAVESGGDLTEGTPVPGTLSASNLNATLVFTPAGSLPVDSQIYARITDGLADACDNALQTGGNGVQLISFHTMAPDTTAPDDPMVYPLTSPTDEAHLQVSGEAEPGGTIRVYGGAAPISTLAGDIASGSTARPSRIWRAMPWAATWNPFSRWKQRTSLRRPIRDRISMLPWALW